MKPFSARFDFLRGLLHAEVDLDEVREVAPEHLVDLFVDPSFVPAIRAEARLHDVMEHVSPY